MKKILKIILEIGAWIFLAGFASMIGLTIMSNSSLLGKYRSMLVQSGSMEPSIMTGDVIIIRQDKWYQKGDVVTFNAGNKGRVTHRIVGADRDNFQTKGDANRTGDNDSVNLSQIMGKVVLVLPKLGYLVVFSKSLLGIIVMIIIPGIIIMADELFKIKKVKIKSD
jgi:signal peptidase